MNDLNKMLDDLRKPFHPSQVSWKPGAVKGERAMALAYADLRAYMNRLDEVCGSDWEVAYEPWGEDRIICKLAICGVTRSSTGEMAAQDEKNEMGGTVAEAQAFKRSAAMFGLGRYLYNLPSGWAEYDPQSRKFTDKAKAQLTQMLVQHYRRATGSETTSQNAPTTAQTAQDSAQDANAPVAASGDATPYYVCDWHNLTGAQYDFVKEIAALHRAADSGPCSDNQYKFLVGLVDGLTNKQHGYMLSLLCQADISKANVPGAKVAARLFDILPEMIKKKDEHGKVMNDDDGKPLMILNPNYRQDICEMLGKLVQQPVTA